MRMLQSSLCVSVILAFTFPPAAWAAEKVPSGLVAKRSGKVSLAAPSVLDMIYTPITPCRAIAANPITTNQTKTFKASGDGDFSAQGGPSTGCGVPVYAKAVSVNVSANSAPGGGYLTAYAAGTPRPGTGSLNMSTIGSTTAGSVVELGAGGGIAIFSSKGTKIFGDITGYYAPQLWAYVDPAGNLIDSSGRVQTVTRNGVGSYTVKFDRSVDACAAVASGDLAPKITAAYTSGDEVNVHIAALGLLPEDYYFNLLVKC